MQSEHLAQHEVQQLKQLELQLQELQRTLALLQQQQKDHQQTIQQCRQKVQQIVISDRSEDNYVLRGRAEEFGLKKQQLTESCGQQTKGLELSSVEHGERVGQLKQQYKRVLEQLNNVEVAVDNGQLDVVKKDLENIAGSLESLQKNSLQINQHINKQAQQLTRLNEESKQLKSILQSKQQNSQICVVKSRQQNNQLLSQFQHLEAQLKAINQQYLRQAEEHNKERQTFRSSRQALLNEKAIQEQRSEALRKDEGVLKVNLEKENVKLKAINENDKQLNMSIALSQNFVDQKLKDNQELGRKIKKVIKDIQAEQNRIKEQKANEKKKNFKLMISQAYKNYQTWSKQLEMHETTFKNTNDLKRKYVSHQNLQILEKELKRHQLNSSPNLDAKTAETDKLKRQNKNLKENIARLKRLHKESQAREEKVSKQVKAKGQYLKTQKQELEKNQTAVNSTLTKYLKQYPDHEKNVEARKQKERRQRIQEKKRKADQLRQSKEIGLGKKKSKSNEEYEVLPKIQPQRPQKLYDDKYYENNPQNLYFQLAIGALAILIIFVAWNN